MERFICRWQAEVDLAINEAIICVTMLRSNAFQKSKAQGHKLFYSETAGCAFVKALTLAASEVHKNAVCITAAAYVCLAGHFCTLQFQTGLLILRINGLWFCVLSLLSCAWPRWYPLTLCHAWIFLTLFVLDRRLMRTRVVNKSASIPWKTLLSGNIDCPVCICVCLPVFLCVWSSSNPSG